MQRLLNTALLFIYIMLKKSSLISVKNARQKNRKKITAEKYDEVSTTQGNPKWAQPKYSYLCNSLERENDRIIHSFTRTASVQNVVLRCKEPTPVACILRRRSVTACLLVSLVRAPLRTWLFVSCVCFCVAWVAASATSWSLVSRRPTGYVNVCVRVHVCVWSRKRHSGAA